MNKLLLFLLGCILSVGIFYCSASDEDGESCRTYAKVFVDDQGTPVTTTCDFSSSTYELTCTADDASTTTTIYYYSSVDDFIAEVGTIFLDKKVKITIDDGSTTTYTYTRNADDQITEIDDTTNTEIFSSWDVKKRPVLGEYTYTGCTSAVLSIAYDEENMLYTKTYTGGTGTGCLSYYRKIITIDEDGNLKQEVIDNEGVETSKNYTISSTSKVCSSQ